MSDTRPNAFRQATQKLTRLSIDGVDVNPVEVAVDVSADIISSPSRFKITIGCITLHHELQQAGIDIQLSELSAFVDKDLNEHPQEALSGYLGIVNGILGVKSPQRRWRLFAKSEPAAMLKWTIVRAEQVVPSEDRLDILGVAIRIVG